jgi:hypothetical protein
MINDLLHFDLTGTHILNERKLFEKYFKRIQEYITKKNPGKYPPYPYPFELTSTALRYISRKRGLVWEQSVGLIDCSTDTYREKNTFYVRIELVLFYNKGGCRLGLPINWAYPATLWLEAFQHWMDTKYARGDDDPPDFISYIEK